jgi:hypothetical protein
VSGLIISCKTNVNSVEPISLDIGFTRFTEIGTPNNATLTLDGIGNNEINGDSYSYFEIVTKIGTSYTAKTKLNIKDIDTGNILHGKIIALNGNTVLALSNEITEHNIFMDTEVIFIASGILTKLAFHPGRNIDVIAEPTTVKQSDFVGYVEYTTNVPQDPLLKLNKKLEYSIQSIIPEFIKSNNPKFVEYMKMYGKFLDTTFDGIIYGLTDLYDADIVNTEFLESLLDQYFKNGFDKNKMIIGESNNRMFILLSKIILKQLY